MWNLLEWLYPLMTTRDCILCDEGKGPFIDFWNTEKLGPQPTQEYLDENLQEFELESLRKQRIMETKAERDLRIDNSVGTSSQRKKNLMMARQIKLLYKKVQGKTIVDEDNELEDMEVLSDLLDSIDNTCDSLESWLEHLDRTLKELEEYDAPSDPSWP